MTLYVAEDIDGWLFKKKRKRFLLLNVIKM